MRMITVIYRLMMRGMRVGVGVMMIGAVTVCLSAGGGGSGESGDLGLQPRLGWTDVQLMATVQVPYSSAPTPAPRRRPSRMSNFWNSLATVSAAGVFQSVCPRLYSTPLFLLTPNDIGSLQACDANGYMVFGVYIYTGQR